MRRREYIDKKKEEIGKNPRECLEALLLRIAMGHSDGDPEKIVEWAIAFAEHIEEHPELWGEKSAPLTFKSFKERVEGFIDLFKKATPK